MTTPTKKKPSLRELADRIDVHLKRFEADRNDINRSEDGTSWGLRPFYYASASPIGRYVSIHYVTYQGNTCISRDDAIRYLAKLDSGFAGRHWEALRK